MLKKIFLFLVISTFFPFAVLAQEEKTKTTPADTEELIRLRVQKIELDKKIKEVEKKIKKEATPAEQKARKEVEKEEKKAENKTKREIESRASLDIKGCNPDTVVVNSVLGTTRGIKSSVNHSMIKLVVFNRNQTPIGIRSTLHNTLVENLCPGGSLTLTFASTEFSPSNTQIELTAYSSLLDGAILTETRQVSIYKEYDWNSRTVQSYTWEVRLR